jgi:hypothetical protein
MSEIFATIDRVDHGHGHFTLVYLVYNGDTIGSYSVHYKPIDHALSVPYGASRDYHRLASDDEIAARHAWEAFEHLPADEQNRRYDENSEPDYAQFVAPCNYHGDALCVCDGSSLVQVTTSEQEGFHYAAMMARVSR